MSISSLFQQVGACSSGVGGDLFGIPTWYKYLDSTTGSGGCEPTVDELSDLWGIGLALIEILIRISAYVAIGFVIWGAIRMIVSQGNPDGIRAARQTLMNALIGLLIAIVAVGAVSAVGGQFT